MSFDIKNKFNTKALEAPSYMIVLIIFVALIAILVLIALFFGESISNSDAFQSLTEFTRLGGGW